MMEVKSIERLCVCVCVCVCVDIMLSDICRLSLPSSLFIILLCYAGVECLVAPSVK